MVVRVVETEEVIRDEVVTLEVAVRLAEMVLLKMTELEVEVMNCKEVDVTIGEDLRDDDSIVDVGDVLVELDKVELIEEEGRLRVVLKDGVEFGEGVGVEDDCDCDAEMMGNVDEKMDGVDKALGAEESVCGSGVDGEDRTC